MGRKKKKQLKPWCWYPSVWDVAGELGGGGQRPGPVVSVARSAPSSFLLRWGFSLLSTPVTAGLRACCGSVFVLLSAGMWPGPCPSPRRGPFGPLPRLRPRPRPRAAAGGRSFTGRSWRTRGRPRRHCRGRGGNGERVLSQREGC